jgi:dTDP-4-amino-4,6-dideoxygalactose transaminase
MGIAVLPYMETILKNRKQIVAAYNENLDFSKVLKLQIREKTEWNCSYYPVLFSNEQTLLRVQKLLNDQNVFPRRYFYPSLNSLPFVENVEMKESQTTSERVICLPLYNDLLISEVLNIIQIINTSS